MPAYVTSKPARRAATAGHALGVWCVAGPELLTRLGHAHADEDYPCRFALVRTVLDWYRTGLTTPVPRPTALELMRRAYLDQPPSDDDIIDASSWCTDPIDIGGRRSRYSLLTLDDDRLSVNDYVQDNDRAQHPPPVPGQVWMAALENATAAAADRASVWNIGWAAEGAAQLAVARAAWQFLAEAGVPEGMWQLGALLAWHGRPVEGQRWYEAAIEAGSTDAMVGLGQLLERQAEVTAAAGEDAARQSYEQAWGERARQRAVREIAALRAARQAQLKAARGWYEKAVQGGSRYARSNLGTFLERHAPGEALRWYEQAAEAGDDDAAFNLGNLLARGEPAEAQRWYEQAARAGRTAAMNNLGVLLLRNGKPDEARRWFEQAAQAGDEGAVSNLQALEREARQQPQ